MDNLLHRLDLSVRLLKGEGKHTLAQYIAGQLETLQRIQEGAPYLLCTYYVPPELLLLYDVEVLYIERIVGLTVSTGLLDGLSGSLPPGICSYQRAFFHLMEQGALPKPCLLLSVDFPCGDAAEMMERLHERWAIPIHRIRKPYMKHDLMAAAGLLEKRFSRKRDEGDVSRLYNRANAYKKRIDALRLRHPGLADSGEMLKLFTVENDFGSEKALMVLQGLYHSLSQRAAEWQAGKEFRILWMGLIPLYNNNLLAKIEAVMPVRFVWEEMWMFDHPDCPPAEPADDLRGLFYSQMADRLCGSVFYDPAVRCRKLTALATRMKVDLVIDALQRHCSFLPPLAPSSRSALEKAGIAFRIISADMVRRGKGDQSLEDECVAIIKESMEKASREGRR